MATFDSYWVLFIARNTEDPTAKLQSMLPSFYMDV